MQRTLQGPNPKIQLFFLQEEVEEAEILKKFSICNVSCKGMEGTTSCLDLTIFLPYYSHLASITECVVKNIFINRDESISRHSS